jgi:hypothetical protein
VTCSAQPRGNFDIEDKKGIKSEVLGTAQNGYDDWDSITRSPVSNNQYQLRTVCGLASLLFLLTVPTGFIK